MSHVFISHSSKDKPFVMKLAIDLINSNFPIWIDSWEIELGDSLLDKIYKAIDDSFYLIIVLSNNSIQSDWVKKELNLALQKEEQIGRKFIIPILAEECAIPLKIEDRIYANFSNTYLDGLEKLTKALEKWGINSSHIPFTKQIFPLTFTNSINLKREALEKRIVSLLKLIPNRFNLNKEQFLIKKEQFALEYDIKYQELRSRLVDRIENIKNDDFYSPDFEDLINREYSHIQKLEEMLIDGLQLMLNNMVIVGNYGPSICCVSAYWYAKIVRSLILARLYMTQNPNLSNIIQYGKNCIDFAGGTDIEKFYEVTKGIYCLVGHAHKGGSYFDGATFRLWVPEGDKLIKGLELYNPVSVKNNFNIDSEYKYLIPQMVFWALYTDNPRILTWDFEEHIISMP